MFGIAAFAQLPFSSLSLVASQVALLSGFKVNIRKVAISRIGNIQLDVRQNTQIGKRKNGN